MRTVDSLSLVRTNAYENERIKALRTVKTYEDSGHEYNGVAGFCPFSVPLFQTGQPKAAYPQTFST